MADPDISRDLELYAELLDMLTEDVRLRMVGDGEMAGQTGAELLFFWVAIGPAVFFRF